MTRPTSIIQKDIAAAIARIGQPTRVLSPQHQTLVLDMLKEGATLTGICRRRNMPAIRDIYATAEVDEAFADELNKARALQATTRIDRAQDVLDQAMEGADIDRIRGAAVYSEQITKHAAKIAPRQYGDMVKLANADGGQLAIQVVNYATTTTTTDGALIDAQSTLASISETE